MEKLVQKLNDLKKAFKTLDEIINEDYSVIVRDATIQRFEYTFEILWKTIKEYLEKVEYVPCNSPKSCFREALREGLLSEEEAELCLEMLED
ncbi:nucleotidyltransferase substrate binding protein, partial [Sulfurihydrogenibium sp.]|uniref:nucleotidyltransferase substrate binding protein n=1 Tax=Sulfurihydrogenibium sp. TaxID=2053621 RepID=UPI002608AA51